MAERVAIGALVALLVAAAPSAAAGAAGAIPEPSARAAVTVERSKLRVQAPGRTLSLPILVRNLGDVAWPAERESAVALVACWRPASGAPVGAEAPVLGPFPLSRSVAPGGSIEQQVDLPLPARAGRYSLEIGVEQIAGARFASIGNTGVVLDLRVADGEADVAIERIIPACPSCRTTP